MVGVRAWNIYVVSVFDDSQSKMLTANKSGLSARFMRCTLVSSQCFSFPLLHTVRWHLLLLARSIMWTLISILACRIYLNIVREARRDYGVSDLTSGTLGSLRTVHCDNGRWRNTSLNSSFAYNHDSSLQNRSNTSVSRCANCSLSVSGLSNCFQECEMHSMDGFSVAGTREEMIDTSPLCLAPQPPKDSFQRGYRDILIALSR